MSELCISCGKEFHPVKTLRIKESSGGNQYYNIDFCFCGLGKTKINNSNTNVNDVNSIYYNDIESRLLTYYYRIYNHYSLRYNESLAKLSSFAKGEKLLELGANIGFAANIATHKGYDVTACEINDKSRRFSELVYGLKTKKDFFEITDYFDIIMMCDVIEHFHNPAKVLEKAYDILNKGGVVFIQLPNHECNSAKRKKEKWDYYGVPDHTFHFSYKALKSFVAKYGFTIEWSRTVNSIEDFFIFDFLPQKFSEKIIKLINSNPFYYPGFYESSKNKGAIIQLIASKK